MTKTMFEVLRAQLLLADASGEPVTWHALAGMVEEAAKSEPDVPEPSGGPPGVCPYCQGTGQSIELGPSTTCDHCEGTGTTSR